MKILKSAQFFGISPVSKVIQRQTGPYSHTAIFVDQDGKDLIQQLTGKDPAGIDLLEQWPHEGLIESWMDYSSFDKHTKRTPYEIWGLEISNLDWAYCMSRYIKSCEDRRPYDWAGIMNFRLKSIKEDPDRTFCSEEYITPVVEILKWDSVEPHTVHPTMSVNLTQAAGGRILSKGFC
jgi:hypothetical protein